MKQIIKLSLLIISISFLLSSCANRKIVIPFKEVRQTQIKTWAEQTNVKEDVDISDLQQTKNTSIGSSVISSDTKTAKMKRVYFPINEYNQLKKLGNATVRGSIYLNNDYDKKRILGSNTRLYLNPVTSYSKQWYYQSYLAGYKMEKADSRLFNYLRFTSANTQGQFAFYGVPPGKYYLIGTVRCAAQCGYSIPKNIRIASEITVLRNRIIEKELTRSIH